MSSVPRTQLDSEALPVPMRTLHERIDEVRQQTPDFQENLRDIAGELPVSFTRQKLLQLAKAIDENQSAAQLASSFPKLRWLLTVPSSSSTTDLLMVMLEQSTYDNAIQQRRIGKAAYPICLMVVGMLVFFFICIFVVPTFIEMYDEFGLQLPGPTQSLFTISKTVNANLIGSAVIAVAVCVTSALVLWAWISEGPLKRAILGVTPKSSQSKFSLAGAAQQLAELSDAGIPLERSLRITAESNTEPTLRAAIGDLANQARKTPNQLQQSRASIFLPPNFILALSTPQHSEGADADGQINSTLMRAIARSYRDLSVHRKDWTSFLLGPLAFIFMGGMVFFVVAALFAPMLSLITSLST